MSRVLKVGSKLAESAIDKAIISSLSPFITPVGAYILAKSKALIIGIVILAFILLTALLSGGGGQQVAQNREQTTNPSASNETKSGNLPTGINYKVLNVPYANQWLNKDGSYAPTNIIDDWQMGWMTCGATTSVMVAGYYGKLNFSDDKSLKEYVYSDKDQNLPNYCNWKGVPGGAFGVTARGYCNQSSGAGIQEYLARIGLKSRFMGYSFQNIINSIDQGRPIILGIYAPLGHILVIKGYTEDGRVIVNDPYGNLTMNPLQYSFSGENAIYDLESSLFYIGYLIQVYQ